MISNSAYTLTYDNIVLPNYGQTAYLSDGLQYQYEIYYTFTFSRLDEPL